MRNKRHKRSITKLIFYLFPLLIYSIESLLQIYRKFCSIAVFVWYTLWQQLAEATHTRVKTSTLCVLLSCYEIIILSVWWYLYTFTSHVWCSVVLARNPQCSFQNVRIVRQTVRLYRQRFSFAAQVNCTNNIANFWVKCWYSKATACNCLCCLPFDITISGRIEAIQPRPELVCTHFLNNFECFARSMNGKTERERERKWVSDDALLLWKVFVLKKPASFVESPHVDGRIVFAHIFWVYFSVASNNVFGMRTQFCMWSRTCRVIRAIKFGSPKPEWNVRCKCPQRFTFFWFYCHSKWTMTVYSATITAYIRFVNGDRASFAWINNSTINKRPLARQVLCAHAYLHNINKWTCHRIMMQTFAVGAVCV